jgi:hypothetical protein
MKLRAIIASILFALFVAVPSSMAACGEIINVKPGDPVTLSMTPDGSYSYTWTITGYASLPDETSYFLRTFLFEAPVIDPAKADQFGCENIVITGQLITKVGQTEYAGCSDQCTVTLHVCPRSCPTLESHSLCISTWDAYMANTLNDEVLADWQLDVTGSGPWQGNDVFTWTVKDENGNVVGTHVGNSPIQTFGVGDFTPAPTNDDPEQCFFVSLVVKSNAGQELLNCPSVGKVCLIYDPQSYNSGQGIGITSS